MVAMRTAGDRRARGARRLTLRVLEDVPRDALKLVVPSIGLLLSVAWVRSAEPSWYSLGVEPLVHAAAASIALLIATLAGLPSGRRASAVQPIVAMRAE